MEELNVKIGNKPYKVRVAYTDEEREKGLQNIKDLPKEEGMLFIFEESDEVSIWMKDTLIPLDIIFIDQEFMVKAIHSGKPQSEDLMTEKDINYVLEVNTGSGVKIGEDLEFSPDSKVRSDKMVVLNENGVPQMELDGGERIFSRANTKILIKFAKKAQASGRDNDFKALGKRVFKFLKAQDDSEPEYVSKN